MRAHRREWMECLKRGHELHPGEEPAAQLRAYRLAVDLFLADLEPVFEDDRAVAKLKRAHSALPPAREGN